MKKPIYFFDMDGVLAKWNAAASEEETHMPGYFASREYDLSALALVAMLKAAGEKVCVLSAVYEDDHSAAEKKQWLQSAGIGDVDAIFVPYGANKHDYIQGIIENGFPVLIDDYSRNLSAWEDQGYLSIKYMNGINNMPKVTVMDGVIHVRADTWPGYSIDARMTTRQMYTAVTAISEAEAAAA